MPFTLEHLNGENDAFDDDDYVNLERQDTITDTATYLSATESNSRSRPVISNAGPSVSSRQNVASSQAGEQRSSDRSPGQREVVPPWQRINGRLTNWAAAWTTSELQGAEQSTERGHQINSCALTIWMTLCYKRYLRAKLGNNRQPSAIDCLYVPPNVADAINGAVAGGRHGEAGRLLKEMWTPFGLDGMPSLIIALTRYMSDDNH